ncbi:manganese/iron transport system permease protein [Arcanobacterium pluranimalium]|uniref:anchored repeat-type ABC transporter permease subunit n=1 Tax=Arcanobacterium pluranimalium TaxID=108028 RepID=UPI001958EA8A|nr:anchored repeat-type ABC transporter permease subunit [Arcanobacterium pluranimalium]MBM7824629.1 manganese/iron transport system permease protein [Arcanobacterium pluranimalium]
MSFIDFLNDLTNPVLAFLPRALLIAIMSSVVCGVVGVHVVLRGLSFVGDALSHAVFPGVAIAFALQGSILLGGAVAGVVVAILITTFSQNRRLREDSIIGIFFAAAFALGLVIMSRIPGYTGSLESFLFGSLSGVTNTDLIVVAASGFFILAILALLHPYLVLVSIDRDHARALGIKSVLVDLVLYLAIAATVVISVQSIGNILILALLIAPAASARMLTDRVVTMMVIGPVLGSIAAFIGVWASWQWNLPTGAAIVLCSSTLFVLIWIFAPRRGIAAGVLSKLVRPRKVAT